jgi:hypothetical protein
MHHLLGFRHYPLDIVVDLLVSLGLHPFLHSSRQHIDVNYPIFHRMIIHSRTGRDSFNLLVVQLLLELYSHAKDPEANSGNEKKSEPAPGNDRNAQVAVKMLIDGSINAVEDDDSDNRRNEETHCKKPVFSLYAILFSYIRINKQETAPQVIRSRPKKHEYEIEPYFRSQRTNEQRDDRRKKKSVCQNFLDPAGHLIGISNSEHSESVWSARLKQEKEEAAQVCMRDRIG